MKNLLFLFLFIPYVSFGQLYFLESVYEYKGVWDTSYSYYGGDWNWLWEQDYVEFSEYNISTSTLASQILDDSIVDASNIGEGFGGLSCFDPTTNILYALGKDGDDNNDTTYICALDVTTGNVVLEPIDIGVNDYDPWSGGTSPTHGDTSYSIYTEDVMMECWNNKLYFLESIYYNEQIWDTSYYGGEWMHLHDETYVEFSVYDVATSTLESQILDTSIIDLFNEAVSCFDPTTNTLYALGEDHDQNDTTYLGALDVTTGNIVLEPVDIGMNDYGSWDDPSHGDTSHMILTEDFVMEVGYKLPGDSVMNIISCDEYIWNENIYTSSGTYTFSTKNSIGLDSTVILNLTINSVVASITQSGESLSAVTTPSGLDADWYNIQQEDSITRIWLMERDTISFVPTFECSYFIVVEDDNGCVDTSETYYYGANAARIGAVSISPNPTSGIINVNFENPKNQFVKFELISNNGAKLDEFITLDNNLSVDLSKYSSGVYHLYFNGEDISQGCRLEVEQKKSIKIILNK